MRSFTYHLFYEHPVRTELSRNLLGVVVKTNTETANKLAVPYITAAHLTVKANLFLQLKLICEVKALHKRRVIVQLFRVLMWPEEKIDEAIKVLSTFDEIRNSRPQDEKSNSTLEPLEIPAALKNLGEAWITYIFPYFDYNSVSDAEYKELCSFLVRAFESVAAYRGIEEGAPKGLEIEHFRYENLPIKLRESIKNVDFYKTQYELLVAYNTIYASITDEVALSIYKDKQKFEENNIVFSGYVNYSVLAEKLVPDVSNTNLDLINNMRNELFHFGILFIHESQVVNFIEAFKRYGVIKQDKITDRYIINEHNMRMTLAVLKRMSSDNGPEGRAVSPPLSPKATERNNTTLSPRETPGPIVVFSSSASSDESRSYISPIRNRIASATPAAAVAKFSSVIVEDNNTDKVNVVVSPRPPTPIRNAIVSPKNASVISPRSNAVVTSSSNIVNSSRSKK